MSFYTLSIISPHGSPINFQDFSDKKILIVNVSSGNLIVNQLAQLKELQQRFADSLVVIALPSDRFTSITDSNSQLNELASYNDSSNFLIAEKSDITGERISPLFFWFSKEAENGVSDITIKEDFQKILISESRKGFLYY